MAKLCGEQSSAARLVEGDVNKAIMSSSFSKGSPELLMTSVIWMPEHLFFFLKKQMPEHI
jgi:hypothetical protein